jgi:hypothetical protein
MRGTHRIGGNRHRLGGNGYAIWWQDARIGGERGLVAKCQNWWRGVMFFHSDWWQDALFRAIMREIHRIGGNRHRLGGNGYAIWWQDTRIGGDRVLVAKCRNRWRGVMFFMVIGGKSPILVAPYVCSVTLTYLYRRRLILAYGGCKIKDRTNILCW